MCESFGCLPSEAEREDPARIDAILEYRAAKLAVSWMNEGTAGAQKLADHPEMLTLLKLLYEAQGIDVSHDTLMEEAKASERDDEE